MCQYIADSLDEGFDIGAVIIDFSKACGLFPYDRLLMKLAATGVVSRVVVWGREFLVVRTQRVRVGGQLSKEVKVTSGVPQGSISGPLSNYKQGEVKGKEVWQKSSKSAVK